jgi:uncharacterized protein YegP (UPF0339 family)
MIALSHLIGIIMIKAFLEWLSPKVVRNTSNDKLIETMPVKKKPTVEIYKDKKGEFRWRIVSHSSEIIGASCEGYSSKQSCENNLKTITNLKL